MVYTPLRTKGNEFRPSALVTPEYVCCVASSTAFTDTWGIAAPLGSITRPTIDVREACCAKPDALRNTETSRTRISTMAPCQEAIMDKLAQEFNRHLKKR